MGFIQAVKAKLFANQVEQATQASIDLYVGVVNSVLTPIPAVAGEIAKIVVNNQDEIERSIVLAKKLKGELEVVWKTYESQVNEANPELKKLSKDFEKKLNTIIKMFKK